MAEFQFLLQSLLHRASAQGSRSSVLGPLIWTAAVLMASLVGLAVAESPNWLPIFIAVLAGMAIVGILAAFAYFARKDPDSLRSERFMLTKLALEKSKSVKGDNLTGLVEAIISERQPSLPPVSSPPSATGSGGAS